MTEWFLDTMADPERSRIMLSPPFIAKYEELSGEPREWVKWVREEMERQDREFCALAEEELKRPGAAKGAEKPRWRASMTVYTPSHSIRAKVLRVGTRVWIMCNSSGWKKDRFSLQITLHDNLPVRPTRPAIHPGQARVGLPEHRDHRLFLVRASRLHEGDVQRRSRP